MKPEDRENKLYKEGKKCCISIAENILFEYLDEFADKNSRILDIGCGSGEIARKIKEKGHDITGLDFSEAAVESAQKLGIKCRVSDLDRGIPFDDNSFDIVWAGDVIEHVFDPIFVLREINRVLVPDGLFLCTVPYDLKLITRIKILFGHSYQEGVYKNLGQYKHHTFFSVPLLKYMFKESSLRIREIRFVIKFPKLKKEFISYNRVLIWFAKTMAVRAASKKQR